MAAAFKEHTQKVDQARHSLCQLEEAKQVKCTAIRTETFTRGTSTLAALF